MDVLILTLLISVIFGKFMFFYKKSMNSYKNNNKYYDI